MSYEIVYAREFVKTGDGRIIPLVLSGSNNCWAPTYKGKDRRVRQWFPILAKQSEVPAFTSDEIMKRVSSHVPSNYQQHFVRNGKWVNDEAFVRFFKNGIKNSKTLEELYSELLWKESLFGRIYYYDKDSVLRTIYSVYINSTPELDSFLGYVDKAIKDNNGKLRLYIGLGFSNDNSLERKKDSRPKRKKLEQYFVVTTGRGYLSRLTRLGIYSTYSKSSAKQFDTEMQAKKWIKDRQVERRFPKLTFGVEYVA